MFGYIYITTNLVNGKKYIGRHCSQVFDKNYLGSGSMLKAAIALYGKENFTCELLESCDDYLSLIDKEQQFIKKFNAVESDEWYNLSYGGEQEGFVPGDLNIAKRPEIRKINSEKHLGKVHSTEINLKKGRPGHAPTFTGPHTEESKEKNRQATRNWNLSRNKESYKKVSDHHIGSKMMTDGIEQKWVYRDDIQDYLDKGWKFGSCKKRNRDYSKSKKSIVLLNNLESSTTIESTN